MKTSINVPDWLHREAVALNPDQAFGELVRDALLIALPEWRKNAGRSPVERALRMQLRLETARNALEANRAAPDDGEGEPAPGRRSRREPAPGGRLADHRNGDRRSSSKGVEPAGRAGRK